MAQEQYANNATTTLNGAINNVTTSVVVTSATGFPSSGNFRIKVDSEIMLVTNVSSNTFTVTRGAEGTTAASHSDLAAVSHVLTAAGLLALPASNLLETSGPTQLAMGAVADGNVLQRSGSGLVGLAAGWQTYINDPLSSIASWTSLSGSWAASGGVCKQTNTSGRVRLLYTNPVPLGTTIIMHAEVQMPTASGTANRRVGFFTHADSAGANGTACYLNISTTSGSTIDGVHLELDNVANRGDGTISQTTGTWIPFRVITNGWCAAVYVNGVFVVSALAMSQASSTANTYMGFETVNAEGWYRNFKMYVPYFP